MGLPTECRRRSPPSPPAPSRSRSSLPPRGSTPSGSVAPSSPPCPPSSRCGSPSRSTTSADPPLSTASASKRLLFYCGVVLKSCLTIFCYYTTLIYNNGLKSLMKQLLVVYVSGFNYIIVLFNMFTLIHIPSNYRNV